jgi:hypothetical protein
MTGTVTAERDRHRDQREPAAEAGSEDAEGLVVTGHCLATLRPSARMGARWRAHTKPLLQDRDHRDQRVLRSRPQPSHVVTLGSSRCLQRDWRNRCARPGRQPVEGGCRSARGARQRQTAAPRALSRRPVPGSKCLSTAPITGTGSQPNVKDNEIAGGQIDSVGLERRNLTECCALVEPS